LDPDHPVVVGLVLRVLVVVGMVKVGLVLLLLERQTHRQQKDLVDRPSHPN